MFDAFIDSIRKISTIYVDFIFSILEKINIDVIRYFRYLKIINSVTDMNNFFYEFKLNWYIAFYLFYFGFTHLFINI